MKRFLFSLFLVTPLAATDSFHLAENGKALAPIVISAQASEQTKAVAAELAGYLKQITGAEFAVETGNGARGIVLGTQQEFGVFKDALWVKGYDGKEAFIVNSDGESLRLIGATDLAVSHAAFAFLEELGCRWFFPAKEWEVIPKKPSLYYDVGHSRESGADSRPKILARRIWYGYGAFPDDKKHPLGASCQKDYDDWARHNRMASSFKVYAGHAYEAMVANHKALFEAHPEYLALVKGERKRPQLCISHPAVKELAVKWCVDFFAKNPDREMVSLDCADGDGHCECAECVKLGSISNRVFGLANHAAKIIAKSHPGKMIGLLAYNEHSEPPDFELEPNVYVQLTMGFIRGRYSFDELRELWPKKCKSMGFYDYYSVWLWDFDKLPGGKGAMLDHIQESIRKNASLGATSLDMESGNNWGVHGLGYYVANKFMWNPDADVKAVTADFYDQAFGPASAAMRRYHERWTPRVQTPPIISRQLIGSLFRDLEDATQQAARHPDVLARIDHLKHYLRYNHLRWLLDHEKDKARQKQLSLDILTFAYRTRYEYMNHWNAIQTSFASDAAKKFGEQAWARNDKAPKPWAEAGFVTKAETEQWFREGLEYFQPVEVKELVFDYTKLAPSGITSDKPKAHQQAMQRPERFAIHTAGGPITLDITVGTIAWYRDRADAKWKLEDAQGKTIIEGTQELDGEPHTLTLEVPKTGVYFFECNDSSAGWRITRKPGESLTWLPKRGKKVVTLGPFGELFFHVPAGTKQLQLFASGPKFPIRGPDHKIIAEVNASDEVISIPVPAGADGKIWSFGPTSPAQIWLFNAPNGFAASPQALLIAPAR
ncbi:MAG: DUF4838 domain-containing protein [Verrucomicrobiaceae bacterium]|nr:DUF4838 domain-containing protein [Verrucomicrobiaceae bacterium]